MKIVTQFSVASVIFMLLFNIASGAVSNDTSIIQTDNGYAMLDKIDGQGDTIIQTPCDYVEDVSYVASDGQCKTGGNTCNNSCSKCDIVLQKYNCNGTIQTKPLSCICRNNESNDPNTITCTEEPVAAGTNPCGGACVSCWKRTCRAKYPNRVISSFNPEQASGYICKAYANCPMINFKQYRSNGCSTEERKCCLTADGRDWSAWAQRAVCPALNMENYEQTNNSGSLKDNMGGGSNQSGLK